MTILRHVYIETTIRECIWTIYVSRWRFINEILAMWIYLLQGYARTYVYRRNKFGNNWPQANRNKSDRNSAGLAGLTNSQHQTTNTSAIFVRENYKTLSAISSFLHFLLFFFFFNLQNEIPIKIPCSQSLFQSVTTVYLYPIVATVNSIRQTIFTDNFLYSSFVTVLCTHLWFLFILFRALFFFFICLVCLGVSGHLRSATTVHALIH